MASGGDALGDIPKRFWPGGRPQTLCIQLARKLWAAKADALKLARLWDDLWDDLPPNETTFDNGFLTCFVQWKGGDGCRHTTPFGGLCFPCSQMLPAPHWMHLVLRCPCWQIASRLPRLVYPCAHSMHRVHCFPCSQTSRRLPRFLTALTPFGLPMPSRPLHPFIVAIVPRSPQTFRRRVVHSWRGAWAERRIRAMRTEQRDEAEGRCFDAVAVATAPPFVPGPCCVAHPSCGTAWKTRIFMQRKDRATGSKYRRERYARGFPQVCGQLDTSLYWCASIAR